MVEGSGALTRADIPELVCLIAAEVAKGEKSTGSSEGSASPKEPGELFCCAAWCAKDSSPAASCKKK